MVGLTSHDYILHVDYDTIYRSNMARKIKVFKDNV